MLRILFPLLFSLSLPAQQPDPNVTIQSDAAARLEIDGKPSGDLRPGQPLRLSLPPGEHQLQAIAAQPAATPWRKLILVSSALPATVHIPLRAHLLGVQILKQGTWKDERSGLLWAAADNGSGVTVSQANYYCSHLDLAGHKDWRLPTIDELQPLFGGTADERGFRVIVPLKLSGWAWSSTQGNEEAENWALDFADGARASVAAGDAGLNRALCVRR
ncbi:DUF1566 domain-containing protein [Bryobacter aggregatus]|uniref:Lcl C-terminal domain-containing protein n=1 Tax=Bryobacter aggregatus TaxID=360054 RepID=UPI0004E1B5A2|nr:DUF1566 domain-containing protein [Bryobacter aggregatus]